MPELARLLGDLVDLKTQAQNAARWTNIKKYKQWAKEAVSGVASAAHRICKKAVSPPQPKEILNDSRGISHSIMDSMAIRTNIWRSWWWRDSKTEEEGDLWHEKLIRAAKEAEPLPDIEWEQVETELKRMKANRGMAVDGFQRKI